MPATLDRIVAPPPEHAIPDPQPETCQRDPRLPGLLNEIRTREIQRRNEAESLKKLGSVANLD